jgi:hypothetical protein
MPPEQRPWAEAEQRISVDVYECALLEEWAWERERAWRRRDVSAGEESGGSSERSKRLLHESIVIIGYARRS